MLKIVTRTKGGGLALGIVLNQRELAALREDTLLVATLNDAERAALTELVLMPGGADDYESLERYAGHIGPDTEVNRG